MKAATMIANHQDIPINTPIISITARVAPITVVSKTTAATPLAQSFALIVSKSYR